MKIILKKKFDQTVQEAWNSLEKKNNFVIFQTLNWNKSWLKINSSNNSVFIFIVYKDEKVVALFPFYLQKKFFFKIIKWIGYDVSDYLGPLIDKDYVVTQSEFNDVWYQIISSLKKYSDLLYLDKQSSHKGLFFNPILKYLNCQNYSENYGIKLFDWQVVKKNKKKSLQQFSRKQKKLSKLGKLEFIVDIDDEEEKKEIITLLIKWKKNTNKINNFSNSFIDEFYFAIIKNSQLKISVLKLDNEIIAGILGFKFLNKYFFLIPSYKIEEKTYRYSPGKILLINLLDSLYENNVSFFDFCNGNQTYKADLANQKIDLNIYLRELNLKGFILKLIIKIRNKI
jgi:CelD/BcsL family acetyltransferase involved in cellulose biosynthesis